MFFNNSKFGEEYKLLIESPFNMSENTGVLNPEPPYVYLIDDSGNILADDSGDRFLVN